MYTSELAEDIAGSNACFTLHWCPYPLHITLPQIVFACEGTGAGNMRPVAFIVFGKAAKQGRGVHDAVRAHCQLCGYVIRCQFVRVFCDNMMRSDDNVMSNIGTDAFAEAVCQYYLG